MGTDVDDVGAICIANAMQDLGEVDILAIVHDTGFKPGVGAISSINNWYGHDDIPLWAYKGIFGEGKKGSLKYAIQNKYAEDLIENISGSIKDYDDVPTAVEVLRKTLAA